MKTIDPRNMTWEEIRGSLDGPRERIWFWLQARGPATTSAIAEGTEIPLLTVRPRVSELAALGWVECVGREHREGIYKSISPDEVFARRQEMLKPSQLSLKL